MYGEWLLPSRPSGPRCTPAKLERYGVRGTLVWPTRFHDVFGGFTPPPKLSSGRTYASPEASGDTEIDRHGITTQGIIGVELDTSPHVRWRIIEISQSNFSGIPGSSPRSFSTGIVLHIR